MEGKILRAAIMAAAMLMLTSVTAMAQQNDPQQGDSPQGEQQGEGQGDQQQGEGQGNQTQTTGVIVGGNVYGGGNLADVKGNTEVNICVVKDESNVTTYVAVSKGDGITIKGNVYGGGKGKADEFTCAKAMVGVEGAGLTDNNGGTTVRIGNGTIGTLDENNKLIKGTGNVYGGGEIGRVEKNTVVTIGLTPKTGVSKSEPEIKGNVFGAGAGVATHGYSALVRGNSNVTVQSDAVIGGSVYGGGEIATVGRYIVVNGVPTEPNGGGVCTVTVQDNATIAGNVVGAGKGVVPSYNNEVNNENRSKRMMAWAARFENLTEHTDFDYVSATDHTNVWEYFSTETAYRIFLETLALASETNVTIGGTTADKTATVNGNVYGGSESGFLQRHTYVTILDNSEIGTTSAGGKVLRNLTMPDE